jgi:aerobic-type carbon monoxide dehydrogenase small subunit (CoxS/CutS family)
VPKVTNVEARQQKGVVRGPGKVPLKLNINGSVYSIEAEPRQTLLEVLRTDLHLTGTKLSCNMGECGACTVIIDGKAVYSCLTLAVECENHRILTIEGLADGPNLDPVQRAFIKKDAYQCGFCTPGQIMSVKALIDQNPNVNREDIKQAVSGNICRCGTYLKIFKAAEVAAAQRVQTAADQGNSDRGFDNTGEIDTPMGQSLLFLKQACP